VCQKHLFLGEVQKPDLPATNQTLAWVQLARRVFDQKQKRIEYVYRYLPELPLDFLLYRCDPKGSKRLAPGFPMILIHQSGLRNASDKSMRLALTVGSDGAARHAVVLGGFILGKRDSTCGLDLLQPQRTVSGGPG